MRRNAMAAVARSYIIPHSIYRADSVHPPGFFHYIALRCFSRSFPRCGSAAGSTPAFCIFSSWTPYRYLTPLNQEGNSANRSVLFNLIQIPVRIHVDFTTDLHRNITNRIQQQLHHQPHLLCLHQRRHHSPKGVAILCLMPLSINKDDDPLAKGPLH